MMMFGSLYISTSTNGFPFNKDRSIEKNNKPLNVIKQKSNIRNGSLLSIHTCIAVAAIVVLGWILNDGLERKVNGSSPRLADSDLLG